MKLAFSTNNDVHILSDDSVVSDVIPQRTNLTIAPARNFERMRELLGEVIPRFIPRFNTKELLYELLNFAIHKSPKRLRREESNLQSLVSDFPMLSWYPYSHGFQGPGLAASVVKSQRLTNNGLHRIRIDKLECISTDAELEEMFFSATLAYERRGSSNRADERRPNPRASTRKIKNCFVNCRHDETILA
jgi:hypothetical protein